MAQEAELSLANLQAPDGSRKERVRRGRGIGSRLLAALEDAARREGFDSLSLSVDAGNPAADLYLRAGYTAIFEDGAGIRMIKQL